jgi:hypothetical protein
MQRFLAVALLAAVASCSGSNRGEQPATYERPADTLVVEAGASVPLQYIAWCADEQKAVGKWADSESDARSAGGEHTGKHPAHRISLLWRQRP